MLLVQVAELASLAQLLPPCSPTVRNPAPDSSPSPRLGPLQLLLAACVRFSCCSRPDCVRFHCCSPGHLPPLPAAAPRLRRFSCCLPLASASAAAPDCGCYSPIANCCSPIASTSTAARPIASASTAARPIESASTAAPRLHTSAC